MERREALKLGVVTYNTNRPCIKGHLSERYTTTGGCKECLYVRRVGEQEIINAKRRQEIALVLNRPRKMLKPYFISITEEAYLVIDRERLAACKTLLTLAAAAQTTENCGDWFERHFVRVKDIDRIVSQYKMRVPLGTAAFFRQLGEQFRGAFKAPIQPPQINDKVMKQLKNEGQL